MLDGKHAQRAIHSGLRRNRGASRSGIERTASTEISNLIRSHMEGRNVTEVVYLKKVGSEDRIGRKLQARRDSFAVREYSPGTATNQFVFQVDIIATRHLAHPNATMAGTATGRAGSAPLAELNTMNSGSRTHEKTSAPFDIGDGSAVPDSRGNRAVAEYARRRGYRGQRTARRISPLRPRDFPTASRTWVESGWSPGSNT